MVKGSRLPSPELDAEEQDSRGFRRDNFWLLVRRILAHPAPFFLGLALVLLGTAATLFEPRLFGYAIDDAIVPGRWQLLKLFSLIYFGIVLVRVLAVTAQAYFFESVGQRVTQDLRVELFSHLQRLPVALYDRHPAGRLLTRVTNDIGSLAEMFSAGFVSMISNALLILGILIWMLVLDLRLGLITASVFPILVAVSVHFSRELHESYRDTRSKLSALNAFLAENFLGMKVIQLFNRQRKHLERFDRLNDRYADAQISTIRIFAYFQPAITWAAGIATALLIAFGANQVLDGSIKLGVLVVYFSFVQALFQPLRELADKWNIFLSGMTSAERVFSILSWDPEVEAGSSRASALPLAIRGGIRFENVWFAYHGENWALKDFSLEVSPGEKVGVVGHTGAGKTTLIALLMRFYEPQKGRILLDGKDLREYDKRSLRASIGLIQQDAFLFSGSIEDNIAFWRKEMPEASRKLVSGLGRDRKLSERGMNLSQGERQTISFARALAADPQLWILDEATANMDSSTEKNLQGVLEGVSRRRTCLLIAHRLSTVQNADRILVLHKGNLVEQGTHDELYRLNGLYARLYRYQGALSGTPALEPEGIV